MPQRGEYAQLFFIITKRTIEKRVNIAITKQEMLENVYEFAAGGIQLS